MGLVLVVAAAGCIFTPRPMIPLNDDAGTGLSNTGSDAGRATYGDSATGVPTADAGGAFFDTAAPSDVPTGTHDSDCRSRGDGGFFDDAGNPCDPTAGAGDGGAPETRDASCDRDAASDGAASDGPASDGPASDGAAACDGGVAAAIARGTAMIGARWVVLGAVLAGCVFTPRPMIPVTDDDVDSAARDQDAAARSDAPAPADRPDVRDVRTPDDTVPPAADVGAASDAPVAAFDAGVPFADAGGGFDAGLDFDAPAPLDSGSEAPDAAPGCDAGPDADDASACPDATPTATLDATPDAITADAEVGLGGS